MGAKHAPIKTNKTAGLLKPVVHPNSMKGVSKRQKYTGIKGTTDCFSLCIQVRIDCFIISFDFPITMEFCSQARRSGSLSPNASSQRSGGTGPQRGIAASSPVSLQWNGYASCSSAARMTSSWPSGISASHQTTTENGPNRGSCSINEKTLAAPISLMKSSAC
jgi:hypothetical protein